MENPRRIASFSIHRTPGRYYNGVRNPRHGGTATAVHGSLHSETIDPAVQPAGPIDRDAAVRLIVDGWQGLVMLQSSDAPQTHWPMIFVDA